MILKIKLISQKIQYQHANAIELDVWLSKDGIPIVIHDGHPFHSINCNITDHINTLTLSEIKKLKFKKNNNEFYNENIPTLEEVFIWLTKNKCKCMIEVKEKKNQYHVAVSIVSLFTKYNNMYNRCWVASFNPMTLYYIRLLSSRIVTSFLFTNNITQHLIDNAIKAKQPYSNWFTKNILLRNVIDEVRNKKYIL
jgi:glycerophosphoryl diester phosphodiesterase